MTDSYTYSGYGPEHFLGMREAVHGFFKHKIDPQNCRLHCPILKLYSEVIVGLVSKVH